MVDSNYLFGLFRYYENAVLLLVLPMALNIRDNTPDTVFRRNSEKRTFAAGSIALMRHTG